MAKQAFTVFLLLAAAVALAAAQGKGGSINISVGKGAAAAPAADNKKCTCVDDCVEAAPRCKERPVTKKECKTVEGTRDVEVCEDKCISAGKVITIGKGGISSTGKGKGASTPTQICRNVCKKVQQPTSREVCEDVTTTEIYGCVRQAAKCVKRCNCGTITLGKGKGK